MRHWVGTKRVDYAVAGFLAGLGLWTACLLLFYIPVAVDPAGALFGQLMIHVALAPAYAVRWLVRQANPWLDFTLLSPVGWGVIGWMTGAVTWHAARRRQAMSVDADSEA